MAKIGAMMDVGKRAMMNSQTALQTVAHNIANKTTEGYSRQRVEQVTATPTQEGRLQIGSGAKAAQITRVTNPALDRQLQIESGKMGFLESHAESLGRVEQVFNEINTKGINQYISDFFNSWRELSNNPESMTSRTLVKESAQALVEQFGQVHESLKGIETDINRQVEMQVGEVNKMTKEVAELNEKIMQVEVQGIPANDQRDRRDLLLKKINEKMEIKVGEGDFGSVSVMSAGNALLVSGFDQKDLLTTKNDETGKTDIYFRETENGIPYVVTDRVTSGSIGGILSVRDKTVKDMMSAMDDIATTLVTEVNAAHVSGLDRKGRPANDFFEIDESADSPSTGISVSSEIMKDPSRIAAATRENAPGDNTVAHVVANIQFKNVLGENTATIDDYYASTIGTIGAVTQAANKTRETQDGIIKQLNTLRESISGVSLDEETVKMIENQKAFDASARLIRTADELYDTVLNLKRI